MPDLSVPLGDQWHGRGVGGILDVSVTITERGHEVLAQVRAWLAAATEAEARGLEVAE